MNRNPLLLLLSFTVFVFSSFAEDSNPSTKVSVSKVDLDFSKESEEFSSVLWERFIGHPDLEAFDKLTTENWRADYGKFSIQLLAKAKTQGFDVESLDRCLKSIFPAEDDKKTPPLLPIGAYSVRNGNVAAWVLVCKCSKDFLSSDKPLSMDQVSVWAVEAKTLKKIASVKSDGGG